ncbi:MAG: alpha/beta hydrolase [Actinobacteria bacterium]|nr:alpha/beta hydrolase [Actinomycetota bacterium]
MSLKPEIVKYLADRAALNLPLLWEGPISIHRENSQLSVALKQPLTEIHSVEHKTIPGPTSDLPIRIYRPNDDSDLPALLYFHGGGWVLNFLDIYEPALRKISNLGKFIIVAVQYQKAPEHPFPTPFNDCYATLEWVVKNAKQLGVDPTSIGVGGDSAGGNLASAVALKARDENLIKLAFQLLIYPCNDNKMAYKSAIDNGDGFGLTTKSMLWFWEQYLQNKQDHINPYAVPAIASSLSKVAPAIVLASQYDPLTDDAKNYFQKLITDGVSAIYKEYPGQIHGLFNLGGVTPDADLMYSDIATEINAILGRN